MEHANTAFFMAAGMLFALMVLSLVAYVFSNLSTLPTEEDHRVVASQVAAFNNEYTAYDKKLMYGVDVISILNKAKSNNDKYIREDFVVGGGYNTDYIMDIVVIMKPTAQGGSALEESFTIHYIQETTKGLVEQEYTGSDKQHYQEGPVKTEVPAGATSVPDTYYYKLSEIKQFKAPTPQYQKLVYGSENAWDAKPFKRQTIVTSITPNTYHLLGASGASIPDDPNVSPYTDAMISKTAQSTNTLVQLISQSTVVSQVIKNRSTDINKTSLPFGWSQAIWRPAIYDFKTRKFKCLSDQTITSEKTGRIVKMVFQEL